MAHNGVFLSQDYRNSPQISALEEHYSLVPDGTLAYQVQDLLPVHTPQVKEK